nr:MAG: hypothetical protein [Microvirus sp.]
MSAGHRATPRSERYFGELANRGTPFSRYNKLVGGFTYLGDYWQRTGTFVPFPGRKGANDPAAPWVPRGRQAARLRQIARLGRAVGVASRFGLSLSPHVRWLRLAYEALQAGYDLGAALEAWPEGPVAPPGSLVEWLFDPEVSGSPMIIPGQPEGFSGGWRVEWDCGRTPTHMWQQSWYLNYCGPMPPVVADPWPTPPAAHNTRASAVELTETSQWFYARGYVRPDEMAGIPAEYVPEVPAVVVPVPRTRPRPYRRVKPEPRPQPRPKPESDLWVDVYPDGRVVARPGRRSPPPKGWRERKRAAATDAAFAVLHGIWRYASAVDEGAELMDAIFKAAGGDPALWGKENALAQARWLFEDGNINRLTLEGLVAAVFVNQVEDRIIGGAMARIDRATRHIKGHAVDVGPAL